MTDKKILVVDDVQSMRLVVKYTLEEMGYKFIDQAINGKLALEMLNTTHYDLIISDMEMPILDGLEFLHQLRADEKYKTIPFIMLTAIADKEKINEAINETISGYVLKPVNPNILKQRILHALKVEAEPSGQPA